MAHLKFDDTRTAHTPVEWLSVGRDIGTLANKWSNRGDLVAYVGAGAGGIAPACYNPTLSEVEVNVEVAFGKGITPEQIGDLTNRSTHYEFPKAIGAIMHEAFHARFSSWSMPKAYSELKPDEYQALVLLEESRIEYRGLTAMPTARPFLRACAMEIVIGDVKEGAEKTSTTTSLTNLVGLVHSRIDAGILDADEVSLITEMIEKELGLEVVEKLRSLARQAQLHTNDTDLTDIYPIAIEWAKIVRELAKERGDEGTPEGGMGFPIPMEMLEEILDALKESASTVEVNNFGELSDAEQSDDWKEQAQSKAKESKERLENKEISTEIFSKSSGPGKSRTDSKLLETRTPTGAERSASVLIGRWLEKAKYRERDVVEKSSEVPPGRLRTRALIQREALRSRGVYTKVEPFRKKVRKHTDDPTLKVGIMVDISGSMGSAMNPMATTAWVMSSAVNRIQGECAMVYFCNDVFPVLKSGQKLEQVNVYSAEDGTEKFERAYKALEGSLNLLSGSGARLLVIVSDGCYSGNEPANVRRAMAQCEKAGVAVVWLPFSHSHRANDLSGGYAKVIDDITNPAEASEVIGKACADALTKVGQRAVA